MRLEFGKPQSPLQAIIRIPDRSHPEYDKDGGPFEHVAHFGETLANIIRKILDGEDIPLEGRWIPLEIEDMKLLRDVSSFTCEQEPILTTYWGTISQESVWGREYFPTRDNSYRWRQVSKMNPRLDMKGFELICVETSDCSDQGTHFDEN